MDSPKSFWSHRRSRHESQQFLKQNKIFKGFLPEIHFAETSLLFDIWLRITSFSKSTFFWLAFPHVGSSVCSESIVKVGKSQKPFSIVFNFSKIWMKKDQIILAMVWGILSDFWVPHEIDSWNFQHMLDLWFSEASQNLSSFRQLLFSLCHRREKFKIPAKTIKGIIFF